MKDKGRVVFIGAGCGRYDLITLRGLKALSECDVVVYDSLTDKRLLDFCSVNSEKICVGKRAGRHSESQENINKILVEKAMEGKTVARLKGGDPFVFGRGGEEIQALQKYNILYSIIPGISSSIAAAELSGIPVTHREISRSFHVITGHTSENLLCENLDRYAKLDGTLVFLMGLSNIENIADGLIKNGMSKEISTAVISKCDSPKQRIVKSKLGEISRKVKDEGIEPPAVIVVGETVGLDFLPSYKLPLEHISVAVTSTVMTSEKLIYFLEKEGAYAHRICGLEISEIYENPAFDRALEQLDKYEWLVFTSPNGVDIFFDRLRRNKFDVRKLGQIKFAAIGSGTAEILESFGIYPDLIPREFTTECLANTMAGQVGKDEKILILRSKEGSPVLTEILSQKGISYSDIHIYEPVYSHNENPCFVEDDYLVFSSAGGVRNFFDSGNTVCDKTVIICIGSVTAVALKEYNISDFKIPREYSAKGIVSLIKEEENAKIQTFEG